MVIRATVNPSGKPPRELPLLVTRGGNVAVVAAKQPPSMPAFPGNYAPYSLTVLDGPEVGRVFDFTADQLATATKFHGRVTLEQL